MVHPGGGAGMMDPRRAMFGLYKSKLWYMQSREIEHIHVINPNMGRQGKSRPKPDNLKYRVHSSPWGLCTAVVAVARNGAPKNDT